MPVPGKFSRVELLPRGSLGLEARLARVEPGLVDGEHLTGVGGLHGPDGNAASTAGRGRPVRWGVAGGLAEPGRGSEREQVIARYLAVLKLPERAHVRHHLPAAVNLREQGQRPAGPGQVPGVHVAA